MAVDRVVVEATMQLMMAALDIPMVVLMYRDGTNMNTLGAATNAKDEAAAGAIMAKLKAYIPEMRQAARQAVSEVQ